MFSIIKGTQLELLRDKGMLFTVVLFPTLLVAILGITLGNLDNPDETIAPMRIASVVEDSPSGQSTLIAQMTVEAFADVDKVEFIAFDDLPAARDELARGEVDSVVVFTQQAGIEIYEGNDSIQNRAVHTIFEGVTRMQAVTTVALTAMGASEAASATGLVPSLVDALPQRVEEQTFGVSRTMIDYYAITMIVMMFFMSSATAGASSFYEGRKNRTLERILASPQSRLSLYLQYIVAEVPMNLVQVGIVMVCATVFLGAQYATGWALNVLLFVMLFAAGLAISAVFMVVGLFIRRINPVLLLLPIMWVVLFLSGTFSKEIFVPGISDVMPPALIQSAAFDLTLFGHVDKAVTVLLVSVLLAVVATIVGAILFNRRAQTR